MIAVTYTDQFLFNTLPYSPKDGQPVKIKPFGTFEEKGENVGNQHFVLGLPLFVRLFVCLIVCF